MLKRKQPLALPKSSHSNSYYFTMNDRAQGPAQFIFKCRAGDALSHRNRAKRARSRRFNQGNARSIPPVDPVGCGRQAHPKRLPSRSARRAYQPTTVASKYRFIRSPRRRAQEASAQGLSTFQIGVVTGVSAYGVHVSAYAIGHRRTYRPRHRLMIDHGIGDDRSRSQSSKPSLPGRLPFSIKAPAPALSFRNPRPTSLSFRARRQSTMEAATRLPELNPHHTGPARSSFGATARSIFASWSPPEVCDQSRIGNHCNPSTGRRETATCHNANLISRI